MKASIDKKTLELYQCYLPHGYKKKVAEKAGVSTISVSNFFTGKNKSERIESAILEVIAELKKERKEKLRAAGLL